jgi:leucyl-tRNA synthetase
MVKVKEEGTVLGETWRQSVDSLVLMLAPSAPHLAEELWQLTGHGYSIHNQKWPVWDEELAKEEQITFIVQVNGKLRDRIEVPASVTEDEAKEFALTSRHIAPYLLGKQPDRVIYVPGKLINIVVR